MGKINTLGERKMNNFYKTIEEKMLRKVVDQMFNTYIGENENAKLDGEEYQEWTRDELVEQIIKDIITEKEYLQMEDTLFVLEAKHIRFMGKKRVREIVEHRVDFRRNRDGKWSWEK